MSFAAAKNPRPAAGGGGGEGVAGSGAMFDRIAGRYDALNRVISLGLDRRWRRSMVAALRLPSAPRVLDVATGTGDVALEVLRQRPRSRVDGIDPSTGMLSLARRKAREARVADGLHLRRAVAEHLPYADGCFDGVAVAFGIRNARDRARALREMARVCRSEGRIAILEGSEPRRGLLAIPARFYLHHVLPRIGGWLSGAQEYRYLQRSIEEFPSPSEFMQLMRRNGHREVSHRSLGFGACSLYLSRPTERPG